MAAGGMESFRHQTKLNSSSSEIMPLRLVILLLVLAAAAGAQDRQLEEALEAAKKEKAFRAWMEDMRKDMVDYRDLTGLESADEHQIKVSEIWNSQHWQDMSRALFERQWVHSSFGLAWDKIPPPTIRGTNATATVDAFVAENGWNMMSIKRRIFSDNIREQGKPIQGLPWEVIHDRVFPAASYNGILFISLRNGWQDSSGLAYNPNTNRFHQSKRMSLNHLGDHWYVWIHTWDPIALPSFYEGDTPESDDQEDEANDSHPPRSQTNSTSSAVSDR